MKRVKVKRVRVQKITYQVGQDEQEQKTNAELFNIANMGSTIKAANDTITTQQDEH